MPRIASSRSLWSFASSGIVLSLVVGFGAASLALADGPPTSPMSPGAMPTPPSSPMSPGAIPTPPGMGPTSSKDGAPSAPTAELVNYKSGIERSDVSSAARLQAFLYKDVSFVVRINFARIDYAGLNDFVGELVDKGVGSIASKDEYRVRLREYQKSEVKSSVKNFLSTLQNAIVAEAFDNKIDELYLVRYADSNTTVALASTDGLSDADRVKALDALADGLKPIAVFERYGFVVAVVSDDRATKVDLDSLQNAYVAKARAARNAGDFGGYAAGSSNGTSATSAMESRGSSGYPDAASNAATQLAASLGLSADMYAAYQKDAQKLQDDAKSESRKNVLPFVRRRFSNPATAEDSARFLDALKQTDGAAFSIVVADAAAFEDATSRLNAKKNAADAPIEDVDSEAEESDFDFAELKDAAFSGNGLTTLAVSLVGAPRVVVISALASPEAAKDAATKIDAAILLAKPVVAKALQDKVAQNADADLSPIVDAFFAGAKAQTAGSKVAVSFDFGVLKDNAAALLPLFGGTADKATAKEQEAEEIDWNLGAEDAATSDAATEADDEADPFDDAAETSKAAEPVPTSAPTQAAPVPTPAAPSDEEEEDDPFA